MTSEFLIFISTTHLTFFFRRSNINKEFVKQLFSIEVESDASKALHVEPKQIAVIPHDVAKMLNLPSRSIQNNVIKMSKQDRKMRNLKPHTVAFGRTLPQSLRRNKFNEELYDKNYKIHCPAELRSLQIVFDSILHLGSTRALVEHLKLNPELPRPKFLVDNKLFDVKTTLKQKQQTPLWSRLPSRTF